MTGTYILISIVVFAVALSAMAVGVIVSNRRIKGSCGGLANMRDSHGNTLCEGCTNPSPECQGEPLENASH
ncbi:(Na+)-NQR maturation NqrM [Bythopirellula polymerisocia]|uniref:(Na+)-NQR maturation NqrM n=1 Tax=Bythopirellula polymerisocia TaxID=2528003 RepID=UPI0011B3D4B0|nr:(Na+)-NQR maturation NqrM [Bythopirellula polymerisocia]